MAEPAVTTPHHHAGAYHGHNGVPSLVVLHDEEYPLSDASAEVIARDVFSKANAGGCAQYVIDANSEQHPCAEADISWNAPPNMMTIGIERDGYASWNAKQWAAPKAQMTTCRVAARTAEILARRNLPCRWNEIGALKSAGPTGARGVTSHNNRSKAFGQSDHSDPGPHFPIAEFMALVRRAYAWFTSSDTVRQFQSAHGLTADGVVGDKTLRKAARVLYGKGAPALPSPAPRPVPHPSKPDQPSWHPEPATGALRLWDSGPRTKRVQRRLGLAPDGHFGQDTRAAVMQFQRALGLPHTGAVNAATHKALFPNPERKAYARNAAPHLVVDGIPGPQTLKALQRQTGMSRSPNGRFDRLTRVRLQHYLGLDHAADGVFGELSILTLQAWVGAHLTGHLDAQTWRAVQKHLRDGNF